MDPFLGQIVMFGGNFAPRAWAFCDGQLLPIAQYTALFSILGTTYGGDGRSTFGLPDLRGRFPRHPGDGPGLHRVRLGQKGGREEHQLSVNEMPAHSHPHAHEATLHAEGRAGNQNNPTGRMIGHTKTGYELYRDVDSGREDKVLAKESIVINQDNTTVGGGQAFSISNPYTAVNFIIALQGTFPSRN